MENEVVSRLETYIRLCHEFGEDPDLTDLSVILWGEEWLEKLEK